MVQTKEILSNKAKSLVLERIKRPGSSWLVVSCRKGEKTNREVQKELKRPERGGDSVVFPGWQRNRSDCLRRKGPVLGSGIWLHQLRHVRGIHWQIRQS